MTREVILQNALQSIFDNMHAFIFLKDTENRAIQVNKRVAESHGLTPEEMAGRPSREFYGEQADLYFEDDKEVIRTGVPKLNIIEPLPIDENTTRWIETSKIPVRSDDGDVVGILVIATDITEKREAEQKLADSQQLLQALVENFTEALGFYDADKRLLFGNSAFWQLHEQAGTAEFIRIGDSFEEIARVVAGKASIQGQGSGSKSVAETLSGSWRDSENTYAMRYGNRWIRYRRYPTPDGGRIVFAYDVTESKEAELALQKSEARYQTLTTIAPVGIFHATPDGRCTYANNLWQSLTAISVGSEVGCYWTEAVHADDRARVDAEWRDAVALSGSYSTECRIAGVGDNELWVLATISIESQDDNMRPGFVGSFTDISRLKQTEMQLRTTEQALREHRDQLEDLVEQRTAALREAQQSLLLRERLAAIGQLTATVSHELRNPLGTIVASFAALKRRIDLGDEKLLRTAERIERNVKRCETIIEDLLNYTRVKSLNCQAVDIDTWLMQCLADTDIPEGITVHTRFNAGCSVQIDKVGMSQVMSNLLGNAIDSINQKAAQQDSPELLLEVETGTTGDETTILVADSGTGLSSDDLERVFEPLISTKTFGVGLGLPLVRQIVELHGGQVEIRCRATGGAEVEIALPHETNQSLRQSSEDL